MYLIIANILIDYFSLLALNWFLIDYNLYNSCTWISTWTLITISCNSTNQSFGFFIMWSLPFSLIISWDILNCGNFTIIRIIASNNKSINTNLFSISSLSPTYKKTFIAFSFGICTILTLSNCHSLTIIPIINIAVVSL